MYVYTPRDITTVSRELSQLISLKKKFHFKIFLNLEALGMLPLTQEIENMTALSHQVDFIYLDNSKLTGLTTNAIFMPDRGSLKSSLEIVEKEYYKAKKVPGSHLNSEDLITTDKYTAHHYNIGFGHTVGVYRLFFCLQLLGEEGLQRMQKEFEHSIG